MICAFLFDIGNVLVRFDFSKAYRAIAEQSAATHDADTLARFEAIKHRYEDGQIGRQEFLERAFEALSYRGTESDWIAAWQGIFTENKPMIELVRALRGRFPLYLLSNTNCLHVEGLFRDFEFFTLFNGATYSHVAGASKPEARIFEIACQEHELTPATTFFIDDLPANIATAKQLGFQTHHYHPDRHGELLTALALHQLP